MPDLPKTVLKRLANAAANDAAVRDDHLHKNDPYKDHLYKDHPDANTSTAFAEQLLGQNERIRVTEHLATCVDCREVMAVALPEEASTAATAGEVAGRRWLSWPVLSWPVLRWGFVAAGVALVGSVGLVQYRLHDRQDRSAPSTLKIAASGRTTESPGPEKSLPEKSALENTPSSAVESKPQASQSPVADPRSQLAQTRSEAISGRNENSFGSQPKATRSSATLEKAPPEEALVFAPKVDGARVAARANQIPSQAELAAAGSNASASQTIEAQSSAPAVVESKAGDQLSELAVPQQNADSDVVKAKDLSSGRTAGAALASPSRALPAINGAASAGLSGPLRWTIGANGDLLRSVDAGKSWQQVNVSESLTEGLKRQDAYKKENREPSRAQPRGMRPPSAFRAVAAIGTEVWAGGSRSMLVHSIDFGGHWERVQPSEAGVVLTGDVIKLEFRDGQSGRIATSSGELWTTPDAGKSWHRQQ